MASATHNITGPTTIVRGQGDLRDGAGAINAALADTVAQLRAEALRHARCLAGGGTTLTTATSW
ncbi:MAG: hypothetical protein ACP5ON_11355 [Bacteroidota bacterium]